MSQPTLPDDSLVRRFILAHRFPPPWGPAMEGALREGLAAAGFRVSRCNCLETHPVAVIQMNRIDGETPPVAQIRRLLRRVVRELGSSILPGGLNLTVRRQAVEAELVLAEPAA